MRCAAPGAHTASGSPSTSLKAGGFPRAVPASTTTTSTRIGRRSADHGAFADGRSQPVDRHVVDIAFKCQLCGSCDVTCKVCRYDMWVLDSLHEFRLWLAEQDQVPAAYRPMIANLREKHNMGGNRRPLAPSGRRACGLKDIANSKAEVLFHAGCRYSLQSGSPARRADGGAGTWQGGRGLRGECGGALLRRQGL